MNKICTSIEQSKKLIELGININTADMMWDDWRFIDEEWKLSVGYYPEIEKDYGRKCYPAWSLSALFRVLPKYIDGSRLRMDISVNDFNLWFENLSSGIADENLPDITKENPVDACYEVILKLNEQKLL